MLPNLKYIFWEFGAITWSHHYSVFLHSLWGQCHYNNLKKYCYPIWGVPDHCNTVDADPPDQYMLACLARKKGKSQDPFKVTVVSNMQTSKSLTERSFMEATVLSEDKSSTINIILYYSWANVQLQVLLWIALGTNVGKWEKKPSCFNSRS